MLAAFWSNYPTIPDASSVPAFIPESTIFFIPSRLGGYLEVAAFAISNP